ncbi:NADPH-dependent FMN reductase [Mesonia sp. K7]|uniref:NADPH-dependent FMN reductase n=1 Tax=Mesonia sp. K7 TaxID=2218606 RepID=UPI000DAA3546|nr:NAD(P)H-dependent oxidoreductase [Mesonia sp. K7]PZD76927.1 NADPH-dependent FMN reductase [Mesonia sp. K7]
MKNILAYAGSNSSVSINHELVSFVANQVINHHVDIIRLTDYEVPLYDHDLEQREGQPENTKKLIDKIQQYDALLISVNEHNGGPSAFYKNILDWCSRVDRKFLEGKKVLLMSTSTGQGGGKRSLEYSEMAVPRYGGEIVASFSFPSFNDNFDRENQTVTDETLHLGIRDTLSNFLNEIES